ncbi:MAG TPA: hypothetical protein VIU33_00930 [Nitrospiria bacterium]
MKRNRLQNRIALNLALTCLFWAAYMMVPVGHHLMEHGKKANHAGQHSSAACAWMCASSSFVYPEVDPTILIAPYSFQTPHPPSDLNKPTFLHEAQLPRPPPESPSLSV